VSIIVPVCNSPQQLKQSLGALLASSYPNAEIIVVDDASTDETPRVAHEMGVQLLTVRKNGGPSSARNLGAMHATGSILFFVDADVVIAPGAVARVVRTFQQQPELAAVFGSYDDCPSDAGMVSQYRNLLHHYIHQHGRETASTFWGACGAIRRSVFRAIGGFDEERYPRCIEDIELGYRLRRGGHKILLDKGLQGTHLKRWTLRSVIKTDVRCRALPWARLMLETASSPDDLNVRAWQRLSVALTMAMVALLLAAPVRPGLAELSLVPLVAVIAINMELYRFFAGRRGLGFAAAAALLHLLYFFYGGLTYAYAWCDFHLRGAHVPTARARGGKRLERSVT
jgi:GT2 family glycosyltransferase